MYKFSSRGDKMSVCNLADIEALFRARSKIYGAVQGSFSIRGFAKSLRTHARIMAKVKRKQ